MRAHAWKMKKKIKNKEMLLILYYLKCAWNLFYALFNRWNTTRKIRDVEFLKIHDYLYLVHLRGTYEEMGEQFGRRMADVLHRDVQNYLKTIRQSPSFFLKNYTGRETDIFRALDGLYETNRANYNPDVLAYLRGMATGSGIPFTDLRRLNTVTELTDNHCILLSKMIHGQRLNLRTLDYGGPTLCQALTVFHPEGRIPYATLQPCFAVGGYTGISAKQVFFGEAYHDLNLDEVYHREGMPFHHIAHRILADAATQEEAATILRNCKRQSNLALLIATKDAAEVYLSSRFTCKPVTATDHAEEVFSVTPNERARFTANRVYLESFSDVVREFIPRTKSGESHIMLSYGDRVYVSVTTAIMQSYNNTFYEFRMDQLFP